jgi:hypothetical protein
LGRCRSLCCGLHGHIADSVRAVRTVGDTVDFPRTATDRPRWQRVPGCCYRVGTDGLQPGKG